jgi:hypothetical protein
MVRVWGWEDIEEETAKHAAAHRAFDPTWNPYAEQARVEAKAGFEGLHGRLDAMAPPSPTRSVNPHDADLLREFRRLVTPGILQFLALQDFKFPTRMSDLDPLGEIAQGWLGARYEFVDPEIQGAFEPVIAAIHVFIDLTNSRIFVMDSNPKYGSPKTYEDQAQGLTPSTRDGIRDLNAKAHELWRAIDGFERVARGKAI